jgi:hypothetical protein
VSREEVQKKKSSLRKETETKEQRIEEELPDNTKEFGGVVDETRRLLIKGSGHRGGRGGREGIVCWMINKEVVSHEREEEEINEDTEIERKHDKIEIASNDRVGSCLEIRVSTKDISRFEEKRGDEKKNSEEIGESESLEDF